MSFWHDKGQIYSISWKNACLRACSLHQMVTQKQVRTFGVKSVILSNLLGSKAFTREQYALSYHLIEVSWLRVFSVDGKFGILFIEFYRFFKHLKYSVGSFFFILLTINRGIHFFQGKSTYVSRYLRTRCVCVKDIRSFLKKNNRFVTSLDLNKCLKQIR